MPIAFAADPTITGASRAFANPSLAPRHDVLLRQGALLEVLLDQRVVGLGDRLDQLLASRVSHLRAISSGHSDSSALGPDG